MGHPLDLLLHRYLFSVNVLLLGGMGNSKNIICEGIWVVGNRHAQLVGNYILEWVIRHKRQ